MNHTSSDHPWFQESRSSPRLAEARLVRVVRHRRPLQGRADHLHRHASPPTGPGTRSPAPTTGIASSPTSPTSTTTTPRSGDAMLEVLRFWLDLGPRRLPPRRGAVPLRARGHELREPARDARLPQARARARSTPSYPDRVLLAEANQWPARRGRVLRRRRRMPHGVPLPGHAADVHGAPPRGRGADRRDPAQHAADPRQLPVGAVPAQPRRADARDGHRRGARLHVRRVRQGPADEAQPRASAGGSRRCSTTAATRSS